MEAINELIRASKAMVRHHDAGTLAKAKDSASIERMREAIKNSEQFLNAIEQEDSLSAVLNPDDWEQELRQRARQLSAELPKLKVGREAFAKPNERVLPTISTQMPASEVVA